MGLFCVNFHVRTRDSDAVITALHGRGFRQTRFAPSRGSEWISFYEAHASRQDDGRIQQVAESISDALQAPTIAFLVHDSDIACYWLYDDGTLLDAYNSCPDYFSDGPGGSEPEGGDADLLLPYCRPGTQAQHLTSILGEHTVFAEEVIQRLAEALGIEPMAALSDYRDTDEGGLGEWGAVDGLDDEEDSDDSDGPGADDVLPFSGVAAGNLLQEALDRGLPESSDPQVRALVRAAVEGDLTEIERRIAAGVDLDEAAPAPLLKGSHSKLSQFVPTANLQVPLTPLLAAIVHGHRAMPHCDCWTKGPIRISATRPSARPCMSRRGTVTSNS